MDGHEVVGLQLFQHGGHFTLVVGVQLAGGALYLPDVQAGQAGDAEAQGDGGDDGAGLLILVVEGVQLHGAALSPEPHAVGGELALCPAGFVHRMMVQHFVGQLHQVLEHSGVVVARGQKGADDLTQMVVGRDQGDAGDIGLALNGNVPEGGGRMDHHAGLFGGSLEAGVGKEVGDQLDGLVALNGAAGVGEDLLLLKGQVVVLVGHHVAAVGHVASLQLDAGGGCLQRGAAGVADFGVCAKDGENGGVTAGGQVAGAVDDVAHLALGGQGIHHGDVCCLERGLVLQGGDGVVGHAVADDKDVFHAGVLLS